MIFMKYDKGGRVYYQNFRPFDPLYGEGKTEEQLRNQTDGVLVDEIPEPEKIPGKYGFLYVDLDTKELYYVYVYAEPNPIPEPEPVEPKSEIQEIKDLILDIQNYIVEQQYNNLLENGGM